MSECPELERTCALADGELAGAAAESARAHLATCAECTAMLADVMQLGALPAPAAATTAPTGAAPIIPIAWYRKPKVQLSALAIAAAAGVALYLQLDRPSTPHEPAPPVLALAAKRPLEARLAWQGAGAYRPYDVPRSGEPPHETIPLATLAEIERAGDLHGVGVLALLDGDRRQAQTYLERAGDGADVLADRAALALANGEPARALELTDAALAKAPANTAATWNRALALRDLGLTRGAAAAFREIVKSGEPGWAPEADARAKALDVAFTAQLELSLRVAGGAAKLAIDGTGIAIDDARALPGMARIALYDAVRSAPTRAALDKLRPLAEALDAVAVLERTVPDPALAKGYADILAGNPPDRQKYLAALRAAGAADLLVGALLKLSPDHYNVAPDDMAEFAKLTAASPDPWIQLLGLEQQATARFAAGDLAGTEALLLRARPLCTAGAPNFRCMKIAMLLGEAYVQWQRLPEARTALADAWQRARAASQWEFQSRILESLAELAKIADDAVGGGLPVARAYVDEVIQRAELEQQHQLRADLCDVARWGHALLATILVNQMRYEAAAAELAAAPTCKVAQAEPTNTVLELFVRAEVLRIVGPAEQSAALQREIAAARAIDGLSAGDRAFLDQTEGRLLIDRDPTAAEKLLRHSIEIAKSAPATDANAHRAATISYALLAVAAGARGDGTEALAVLAEEVGLPTPERCALGLAVEDRTMVAIARGATGLVVTGHHARTSTKVDPAELVPADVAAALAGCPVVDVIARPPLHGVARVLPDGVAWRYRSARTRPLAPPNARRLVIADVEPPAALGLPRLAAWSGAASQLSGAAATPARVLAAIGDAGEVVIHAHGLVDGADASYLALSPDEAGRYALTAGDVRAAKLATSPLVILASCSAAQAAPVLHERWSLPSAFVTAGARAVIASTAPIPDSEAGPFFDELLVEVRAGTEIAIALRDVRQRWLSAHPSTWVRDLIVFE